jgi:hypothetical protein
MKKSKRSKTANPFQTAVAITPQVSGAYRPGLQALEGGHRAKIELTQTLRCEGSLNIDDTVRLHYPQANRWDYCFSYGGAVFFVEVHTASTSEVSTVIRKLRWLKDWLAEQAPAINQLKAKTPYYWIQSNGFHILPNSSQYRQAIQAGIKPIPKLVL